MKTPNIVAIVPARGGSKGLMKKNLQSLHGHPLIAYAIAAAKRSNRIGRIIVATDDSQIADIAASYGAEIPCLLPETLTQDHIRLEDTFAYMTNILLEQDPSIEYICFVDPTRPVRPPAFLDEAIDAMLLGGFDSVISGVREHKSVWRRTMEGLQRLDSGFTVRQLKPDQIYICYSGLITCTKATYMAQGERLGPHVCIHEFDDLNMTVDIHTQDELRLAELILAEWNDRYVTL
ncbi:acylneuraminate cytidylyltransferase family protein [Candidatus Uhrbacteria bacterium]|nr:acylneuraminate cytidylyltransferase family protein [Candidatus Uhrbacteria bacterium]